VKWIKAGRIFDPTEHQLPNGCVEFAQSPQAIVFDDHVRIYFSSREVDKGNGKYLSHVLFADFSRDLTRLQAIADNEVLPLGELGAFDEHGIFPLNVLRHGSQIFGYTTGWNRRVSVSVDTAIGLAISTDDGRTFERIGAGPVLGPSLDEPFLVGDGFVAVIGGEFHMWYIYGTSWSSQRDGGTPERTYKIGHARSVDGIDWKKDGGPPIVPDSLGPQESQALPTVIEIDGRHHLFFCYRESFDFRSNSARGYRLGHAYSDDLEHWVRDDEDPRLEGTEGEWDSDMQCYPHVFELDGKICLLYNGNEFGRRGFGLAVLER
jgi:hypothetical protein